MGFWWIFKKPIFSLRLGVYFNNRLILFLGIITCVNPGLPAPRPQRPAFPAGLTGLTAAVPFPPQTSTCR